MTQDVQPLTWQKRTNLEEHQQFFSKINEIIDNLAPTVDEAEAAIAQAVQALADANDAIATANAASAAASAAASQAQTAASTVAGYDSRLTAAEGDINAAEGDIAALQGRMGTAEGNITALQGVQADYVKKAGAAQTVTSQIMVPTTATGTRDTQIANGTRIQNDLAAYEPMIRNTGAQDIAGWKSFKAIEFVKYYHEINTDNTADNAWRKAFSLEMTANKEIEVEIVSGFNNVDTQRAHLYINSTSTAIRCAVITTEGSSTAQAAASNYVVVKDGTTVTLYTYKRNRYTNLFASIIRSSGYGYNSGIPAVTWLNEAASNPSDETHDYIGVGGLIPYRNVAQ